MWISIKEKFPPSPNGGQLYLAKTTEPWPEIVFFHVDPTNKKEWWEAIDSRTITNVTHWMVIPKI